MRLEEYLGNTEESLERLKVAYLKQASLLPTDSLAIYSYGGFSIIKGRDKQGKPVRIDKTKVAYIRGCLTRENLENSIAAIDCNIRLVEDCLQKYIPPEKFVAEQDGVDILMRQIYSTPAKRAKNGNAPIARYYKGDTKKLLDPANPNGVFGESFYSKARSDSFLPKQAAAAKKLAPVESALSEAGAALDRQRARHLPMEYPPEYAAAQAARAGALFQPIPGVRAGQLYSPGRLSSPAAQIEQSRRTSYSKGTGRQAGRGQNAKSDFPPRLIHGDLLVDLDSKSRKPDLRSLRRVYCESPYITGPAEPDESHVFPSEFGMYFTSRNEREIANYLYNEGIPFHYEPPLTLYDLNGNEVTYYPDFVIPAADGKPIIWEHAGMAEKAEYCDRFYYKLNVYTACGWRLGRDLFVTMSDINEKLDIATIKAIVDAFIRCHFS